MIQAHHTLACPHGATRPLRRAIEICDQIAVALEIQIAFRPVAAATGHGVPAGPFHHPAAGAGGVEHDEVIVALILHDDAAVEGDEGSGVGDDAQAVECKSLRAG